MIKFTQSISPQRFFHRARLRAECGGAGTCHGCGKGIGQGSAETVPSWDVSFKDLIVDLTNWQKAPPMLTICRMAMSGTFAA